MMTTQPTGLPGVSVLRWPRTAVLASAIALAVTSQARPGNAAGQASAHRPLAQLVVTNCDDAGPGSQRNVVASKAHDETCHYERNRLCCAPKIPATRGDT